MLQSNERIIRHKVGLLNLAEELGNVSQACKVMGMSRDTFYRYKEAVENGGVSGLLDKTRRQPNLKNRVDEVTESAVVDYALEQPAHGQFRTCNELRKLGVFLSPSGVRSIWLRHQLHCFKSRLKALEAKVAAEDLILTEAPARSGGGQTALGVATIRQPGLVDGFCHGQSGQWPTTEDPDRR